MFSLIYATTFDLMWFRIVARGTEESHDAHLSNILWWKLRLTWKGSRLNDFFRRIFFFLSSLSSIHPEIPFSRKAPAQIRTHACIESRHKCICIVCASFVPQFIHFFPSLRGCYLDDLCFCRFFFSFSCIASTFLVFRFDKSCATSKICEFFAKPTTAHNLRPASLLSQIGHFEWAEYKESQKTQVKLSKQIHLGTSMKRWSDVRGVEMKKIHVFSVHSRSNSYLFCSTINTHHINANY